MNKIFIKMDIEGYEFLSLKEYIKSNNSVLGFAIEFHDNVYEEAIDIIADNCKIFGIGSSWGGYSSLLSTMNVSENRNLKSSYVPTGNYLRIYTGSEDTEDLIGDLNVGFEKL